MKQKTLPSRNNRKRTRAETKRVIECAMRAVFPHDTIDVSDGYRDNLHVMVVSRRFDSMTEREKQQYLWDIIDGAGLTNAEKGLISLILPLSPAEIK